MSTIQTEKKRLWERYKDSRFIEQNVETSEFRCIECNILLNKNPGGAGKHCTKIHKEHIDGRPLPRKISEMEQRLKILNEMELEDQPKQEKTVYDKLQKFLTENMKLLKLYRQAERMGMPESVLAAVREETGWDNIRPLDSVIKEFEPGFVRQLMIAVKFDPLFAIKMYNSKIDEINESKREYNEIVRSTF